MRGSFLWPEHKSGLELTLHLNFQLTICDNDEEIVDEISSERIKRKLASICERT